MSEENKIEEFESWFLIEFKGSKTGLFEKVQNSKSNADIYVSEYVNLAYACYVKLESELTRLREENEKMRENLGVAGKLINRYMNLSRIDSENGYKCYCESADFLSSLKGETT